MIDRRLNYGRETIDRWLASMQRVGCAVDLGAGFGDDLLAVRRWHPEARLLAVENHPYAIERLGAHGIETTAIDIERDALPIADGAADVVIANQILEHTKDIFWVLHEATRCLAVGGSLLVGVPNLASLHNRVLLAIGRQPSVIKSDSAHVRGFTRDDLAAFLSAGFPGGYELLAARGANFYPMPPTLARPLARLLPTMAWGLMLRFVKRKAYADGFRKRVQTAGFETRFYIGEAPD
ncbi:MAG: class I SAM-dependent methyltransferase [Planctomycetota bacterium]